MISKRSLPIWIAYWAAWALFGGLDFGAIYMVQHLPAIHALIGALCVVIPGSTLGLGVWRLSGWVRMDRGRFRFVAQQLGLALGYAVLWAFFLYLAMSFGMGWRNAWQSLLTFLLWQICNGVVAYGIIASVSYAVRTFSRLREEEQRAARSETLRVRAELEALRGKLQPHFLFNTLHNVTALVRTDPVAAEEALLKLGDILRYVLKMKRDDGADDAPLAEELTFVEQYLAIEKIRLGERLSVQLDVAREALACAVPMFTLQPLVENAIVHAISPRAKGGVVRIAGRIRGDRLFLEVSDDGPGAELSTVERSPGFGLRTVRQRLETRFAGRCEVAVRTEPGKGFYVSLALPVEEAVEA